MPLPIQRVPRGLSDVLSIFGGQTPQSLSDQIIGQLDLLQFYALQQRTALSAVNAAAAEGTGVTVALPAQWCLLLSAVVTVVKTATVTALRAELAVNRGSPNGGVYRSEALGPFGATETGNASVPFVPPAPLLCPPNTTIVGVASIIGTDATASVTVVAEFGVLG